jgi:hypothetical protein
LLHTGQRMGVYPENRSSTGWESAARRASDANLPSPALLRHATMGRPTAARTRKE